MGPFAIVSFVIGLVLLIVGADLLVRGASRVAAQLGVSSLIIGLTVVAYGTGAPELAVATRASLAGQADLAVGNVIGSNIFNVLFILGASALVTPLVVHDQLVRFDVPIMILASGGLFFLALDYRISTIEGFILLLGIVGYTLLLVRMGRQQRAFAEAHGIKTESGDVRKTRSAFLTNIALILIGFAMLVLGSRWLVNGATMIATSLGVSELVIGLTIVAAGTSLPEVATSIVAGLRGERDIAVGNVVGSNVYNIFAVLGTAAVISPGGIEVARAAVNFDIPVMVVVAIACLPIFFAQGRVSRMEGAIFLAYWIAYTAYVVLLASAHDALDEFSRVMTLFVIPLTILTLGVFLARTVRTRNR
jgi:cation:H+ antiporter